MSEFYKSEVLRLHKTMGELNSEIRSQEKRIAELLDERDARDLENIELRRVIATLKVGEQTEGWFVSEITEDEDERVVARIVSLLRNGGGGTVSSDDDEDVRHWKVGDVVDLVDAEWKRIYAEPEPKKALVDLIDEEFEASKNPHKPRIVCADGFSLSVQASSFHYCLPREDGPPDWWNYFEEVEVGYIKKKDGEPISLDPTPRWKQWREYVLEDGTCSVYAYVPVDDVLEFIASHGGAVESNPAIPNRWIHDDSN
jgi:regulator of replication initiation timing